jgi:hypothetical protein
LVNAKVGQSGDNVRIAGNSLKVLGVSGTGGKKNPVYALKITNLKPGHLAITDNYFEGSVWVGADPLSTSVFSVLLRKIKAEPEDPTAFIYHSMAYEFGSILDVIAARAQPTETIASMQIDPTEFLELYPHWYRPVVHFTNNRVVRGWTAIAPTTASFDWPKEKLKHQTIAIVHLSNNIFDYSAGVVGYDLIMAGNHSQRAIKYRFGNEDETIANIPPPQAL